jgi:hypothetical protein
MTDFVMHDHMYVAPGVPDPRRANITYRFDAPAKISEVLIVQHTNGIAQVEGFIGDDEKNLKSIGFANSTLGANLPLRENTFAEGYRDVFKFERAGEGKMFRVVITKTPLPNGYAVYRVYPRNSAHRKQPSKRLNCDRRLLAIAFSLAGNPEAEFCRLSMLQTTQNKSVES